MKKRNEAMMRAFKIIDVRIPRTINDFTNYITQAEIEMVDGKQRFQFRGPMPIAAPYFVYEIRESQLTFNEGWVISKAPAYSVKISSKYLNHEALVYMLEMELYMQCPVVVQYLLDQRQHFRLNDNLVILEQVPTLHTYLQEHTMHWKFPLMLEILSNYDKDSRKFNKIATLIQGMSYEKLCEMHETMTKDPIALCYSNNTFFRYPILYNALRALIIKYNVKYTYFELQCVRLLEYFRREIIERHKWTAIHKTDFSVVYYGEKDNFDDPKVYMNILVHLVQRKEILALPYLSTPKYKKNADQIVERIENILNHPRDPRDLLRDPLASVPVIPRHLTDEQTRAALHMLNEPLTIIMGPPGRGKTALVEFATAYWKNPCIVSFIGTVVAMHRMRLGGRHEMSNTAHHIFNSAKFSDAGREWTESFDVLVWDEFSNVEPVLFLKTLEALPNISKLVLVLDINQIQPLKAGSPAMDLVEQFPECCFNLTKNLRVNPRSRELADAILHILHKTPEKIAWSYNLNAHRSMTCIESVVSMQTLESIVKHVMSRPDIYGVHTVMDIQFIAFTRKEKDMKNKMVEDIVKKLGLVPYCHPDDMCRVNPFLVIYPGCKICVRGANFKAVTDMNGSTLFDDVRNGECGTVVTWKTRKDYGNALEVTIDLGYNAQKVMLMKKGVHVDPGSVELAHVMTSNSAQSLEFNTVIGIMEGAMDWTYDQHIYVMSSRAKEAFIMIGSNAQQKFNKIAHRKETRRVTALQKIALQKLKRKPSTTEREQIMIRDPETFVLEKNKEIMCAPVVKKVKDV